MKLCNHETMLTETMWKENRYEEGLIVSSSASKQLQSPRKKSLIATTKDDNRIQKKTNIGEKNSNKERIPK